MTNRTAGELAALIDDEERRQLLDMWRRQVHPTLGEALRDFEERHVREQVRDAVRARSAAVMPASVDPKAPAQAEEASAMRRPVGKPVPGLPSDSELAQELAAEKAKLKKGATVRVAAKYGCNRATIQRHVNAANAARKLVGWPGAKAS